MRLRSSLQRPLRRYILALILIALSLPFWPAILVLVAEAFLGERDTIPPISTMTRDYDALFPDRDHSSD